MTTVELHQGSPDRNVAKPRLRTRIASVLVAVSLMGGIGVATAMPAQAATSSCNKYGCTVYLNWEETKALSKGKLPKTLKVAKAGMVGPIMVGLAGHILIAKGWVAREKCVTFTADIRPWASQAMSGAPCR